MKWTRLVFWGSVGMISGCNIWISNADLCADGVTATRYYVDADGDGYGDPRSTAICAPQYGYADNDQDCDDSDSSAWTYTSADYVGDGLDQNCDGIDGVDADGDGVASLEYGGTDCDDSEPDVTVESSWYADEDGDGYGAGDAQSLGCDPGSGYVQVGGDCDDNNPDVGPAGTWYYDSDNDGYGEDASSVVDCNAPLGYVNKGGDCDDFDASKSPAASDLCNDGYDDNCDGQPTPCALGLGNAFARLEGVSADAQTGTGLAVGDATGDGKLDLLIGAKQDPTTGDGAGAAFLLPGPIAAGAGRLALGSDPEGGAAIATFYGAVSEDRLGTAAALAGNLDDDASGCSDVVLDAYAADGIDSSDKPRGGAGVVYLYDGCFPADPSEAVSYTVPTDADLVIFGDQNLEQIGTAMNTDTSLDSDAVADLVMSAQRYPPNDDADDPLVHRGAVSVFLGGSALNDRGGSALFSTADLTVLGVSEDDFFGDSTVTADFDGTGQANLAIGCIEESLGDGSTDSPEEGAVYILDDLVDADLAEGASITADADGIAKLHGISSGDHLGESLSSADVNGDGTADLIVGAPGVDHGGGTSGAVYVLYGGTAGWTAGPIDPDWAGYGTSASQGVASSVAGGDQNGDGFGDVLLGASLDDVSAIDAGGAYLFYGPLSGEQTLDDADVQLVGEDIDDFSGDPDLIAGDLTGDGAVDLLIGGQGVNSDEFSDVGAVYLVDTIGF